MFSRAAPLTGQMICLRFVSCATFIVLAACQGADARRDPTPSETSAQPVATAATSSNAWTGKHSFSESAPALNGVTSMVMMYVIDVAANGKATIAIDGTQTLRRMKARVEGPAERSLVLFEGPAEGDILPDPALKQGDVLFILERRSGKAVLRFQKLTSAFEKTELVEEPTGDRR